jgi:Tol biopolymer transport system component
MNGKKYIWVLILLVVSFSLLITTNSWSWFGKKNYRNFKRSPDGKKTACITSTGRLIDLLNPGGGESTYNLYVMNIGGSQVKRIAKNIGLYTWSPDGKKIVYEAYKSRKRGEWPKYQKDIYVADTNGRYRKRLTKTDWDDTNPTWTPDGKKISFLSQEKERGGREGLFVINPDGTDKRYLTTATWPYIWSPDEKKLALTGNRCVVIKNPDGTDRKVIDMRSLNEDYRAVGTPNWSPDGKWIAVRASYGLGPPKRRDTYDLLLVDRDGNNLKQLVIDFDGDYYWIDNDHIIYNDQALGYDDRILRLQHRGIFSINIDGTGKKKLRQMWGDEDYGKIHR